MPLDSRGALAFSADEVSVLRRALALALRPGPAPVRSGPERAGVHRELERLAGDMAEAVRESARLRAFLHSDLARYRAALPGSSTGYLDRLREASDAGRPLGEEDLAALRSLCADPAVSPADAARARARLASASRRGTSGHAARTGAAGAPAPHRQPGTSHRRPAGVRPAPAPGPARRLLAVASLPAPAAPAALTASSVPTASSLLPGRPGSRTATAAEPAERPRPRRDTGPAEKPPAGRPDPERPAGPESEPPARPVPTPAEVFPPRRRPAPAPPEPPEEGRAAG